MSPSEVGGSPALQPCEFTQGPRKERVLCKKDVFKGNYFLFKDALIFFLIITKD